MHLPAFRVELRSRRLLPLALAAAITASSLTGCGDDGSTSASSAGTSGGSVAQSTTGAAAAMKATTVDEARELLDLRKWPVPQGAGIAAAATSAATGFRTPAPVESAFAEQRAQLESSGWALVGDAQVHRHSASGTFGKAGHVLSVSVMPDGAGAVVQMMHHGNVDLSTIKPPRGVGVRFAQAISALWESSEAPDAAAANLREFLLANGWEEYGEAGPMRYFRNNAVRLSAMTSAAPDGKTIHHLGVELMPAQIPVPAGATRADFDASAQMLRVVHAGPLEVLVESYSAQLVGDGWKPGDAAAINQGSQVRAWRNAAGDQLALTFSEPQGEVANVGIRYQTRAQIEETTARLEAQAKALRERKGQ